MADATHRCEIGMKTAQEHFKDRKSKVSGKFLLSEQPQRSEQEWTMETIAKCLPTNVGIPTVFLATLLDEINAALAAERVKVENLHKILDQKRRIIKAMQDHIK